MLMRLLCSVLIVALSACAALASDMRGLSVAVALDAVHGSEQFELPLNDEEMPTQAAQFCVTHANKFDVVFGGERRRCELAVLKLAYVALQRSKVRFAFNVTLDGTTHVVEVYKNDTAASAAEHFLRSLGVFTTENAAVLQGEIERLARTDDGTGSLVVDDAAAGEEEAPSAAAEHVAANAAAAGGSAPVQAEAEEHTHEPAQVQEQAQREEQAEAHELDLEPQPEPTESTTEAMERAVESGGAGAAPIAAELSAEQLARDLLSQLDPTVIAALTVELGATCGPLSAVPIWALLAVVFVQTSVVGALMYGMDADASSSARRTPPAASASAAAAAAAAATDVGAPLAVAVGTAPHPRSKVSPRAGMSSGVCAKNAAAAAAVDQRAAHPRSRMSTKH